MHREPGGQSGRLDTDPNWPQRRVVPSEASYSFSGLWVASVSTLEGTGPGRGNGGC